MFDPINLNDLSSEPSSHDSESPVENRFKPKWSEVNCPSSGKRWMHASIIFDKYMIVYAGGNGREAFDDIVALDLETNTWKAIEILGPKPVGRYGHSGDRWRSDTLVVFGGQTTSANIVKETLLIKFDNTASK